jgi:hypothetical protein
MTHLGCDNEPGGENLRPGLDQRLFGSFRLILVGSLVQILTICIDEHHAVGSSTLAMVVNPQDFDRVSCSTRLRAEAACGLLFEPRSDCEVAGRCNGRMSIVIPNKGPHGRPWSDWSYSAVDIRLSG